MLDESLKEQLKSVFACLENSVELVYDHSDHTNQTELVSMLESLSSTSPQITFRTSGNSAHCPKFWIEKNGKSTGIHFCGIPGGHEFTSLVLAILNSDGKGKMPDDGIRARIKNLKGPIRIKTYISLTCENCPDVVQAFHQMALIHDDFQHEMIDGAYVQDEVTALGIQGVPSVIVDSKMIHSGRIHFLDLLTKLEEFFGTKGAIDTKSENKFGHFDVLVAGGGPAGISAAIYSARKGLKPPYLPSASAGR